MPSTNGVPPDYIAEIEKIIRFIGGSPEFRSEDFDSKIVKAIRDCPGMTFLSLEVYCICPRFAEAIGKALESQSDLKRVILTHVFSFTRKTESFQAIRCLTKGIVAAHAHIVELDLSDNSLDGEGIMGLKYFFYSPSSYTLEKLLMSCNILGKEGAMLLSNFMIKSIENSIKEGKMMRLRVFECGYNGLENEGITYIARCLSGLNSLESIDLASNMIGPSGMLALTNVFYSNLSLKKIILDGNNLYEGGANRLSSCFQCLDNLEILSLKCCRVGSNGILHLAMALKNSCPKVRKIDLSFNEIYSNAEFLLDAMKNKKYFENLDISDNEFSEEMELSLLQSIFRIKRRLELMTSDDDTSTSSSGSELL